MPELKPCPFCGSDDIAKNITTSHSRVWCKNCGAGISKSYFGVYGSLAEATKEIGFSMTKAWNRRAEDGK